MFVFRKDIGQLLSSTTQLNIIATSPPSSVINANLFVDLGRTSSRLVRHLDSCRKAVFGGSFVRHLVCAWEAMKTPQKSWFEEHLYLALVAGISHHDQHSSDIDEHARRVVLGPQSGSCLDLSQSGGFSVVRGPKVCHIFTFLFYIIHTQLN